MKKVLFIYLSLISACAVSQVKNSIRVEFQPKFKIKNSSFAADPEVGFYFNDLADSKGGYTAYFRPATDYGINDIFSASAAAGFFYTFDNTSPVKFEFRPRFQFQHPTAI